jgi:AbrB family looped-hinge helix DNA binding protein
METTMPSVKVSPKYQVVIPKEIREKMRLKPGKKFQVFQHGNRIELVPVESPKDLLGFVKGIDTNVERDEEDRL